MNMAKHTRGSQIYFIFFHVVVLSYLLTILESSTLFSSKIIIKLLQILYQNSSGKC